MIVELMALTFDNYKMDFAAIVNHDAGAFPRGLNGMFGEADLSRPEAHVDKKNKIVVDDAGAFDLRGCVGYALWAAQEFPDADTAVTSAHMEAAFPTICIRYAQHVLLALIAASDARVNLRRSDTVSAAEWAASANHARADNAAERLAGYITANPGMASHLFTPSKNVVLAIVANAIHRYHCEGHNWFTADTENPKTATGRAVAVAGANKDGFKRFMRTWGHDCWHFLSHQSLNDVADLLVGQVNRDLPDGTRYGGRDVGGSSVCDAVNIGEAAIDRWPCGVLGKASILVGLDLMKTMIGSLVSKMAIADAAELNVATDTLRKAIAGYGGDRNDLIVLRNCLEPALCISFGFVYASPLRRSDRDEHAAIERMASRNIADTANGELLYTHWHDIEGDKKAVGTFVGALIGGLAKNIESATAALIARMPQVEAPEPYVAHPAEAVEIPPTAAEVAARDQRDMMAQFMRMGAGGNRSAR